MLISVTEESMINCEPNLQVVLKYSLTYNYIARHLNFLNLFLKYTIQQLLVCS